MISVELLQWVGPLAGFAAVVVAWRGNKRADFDSLRDELRKQLDVAKTEAKEAKAETTRIREEGERRFRELEARTDQLEQREFTLRQRLHLAYDYIRILVGTIARTDQPIPSPPAGLDIDLAIRMHPVDPEES